MHAGWIQIVQMIIQKKYLTEMDLLRLQKALLLCRMAADSIYEPDYLCAGSEAIKELPDPVPLYEPYLLQIDRTKRYRLKKELRFRQEDGFSLVHILGGWVMIVEDDVATFLRSVGERDESFDADSFPGEKQVLATFLSKDVVEICG